MLQAYVQSRTRGTRAMMMSVSKTMKNCRAGEGRRGGQGRKDKMKGEVAYRSKRSHGRDSPFFRGQDGTRQLTPLPSISPFAPPQLTRGSYSLGSQTSLFFCLPNMLSTM